MARVTYVVPECAAPEIAPALARLPQAHVFGLMAQSPATFLPWIRMGTALLDDLSLAPSLRELVILQVGRLSQRYEWDQHVPLARHVGVTDEQIAALERGDELGPFDPVQRAVLVFVAAMVADGVVADDDYAVLSELLDEREIVEVAFVAAQYLGLARLMTALQIDSEEPIGVDGLGATAEASRAT